MLEATAERGHRSDSAGPSSYIEAHEQSITDEAYCLYYTVLCVYYRSRVLDAARPTFDISHCGKLPVRASWSQAGGFGAKQTGAKPKKNRRGKKQSRAKPKRRYEEPTTVRSHHPFRTAPRVFY